VASAGGLNPSDQHPSQARSGLSDNAVVPNPSGIGNALTQIITGYENYSAQAVAVYQRYEFDASFGPVLERILTLCPSGKNC
jgi:hypothetical protein